jgi:hypothetical protein
MQANGYPRFTAINMHYCGKKDAKNPTLGFGRQQVAKTVLATIGLMRFKNIAEKAETHINKLSPTKVLRILTLMELSF